MADAAAAVAATLETSARGVIYEHAPPGLPAQALAAELRTTLAQIREQGATVYDHESSVVLRAIETGARAGQTATGHDSSDSAYLDLLARLLHATGEPESVAPPGPESALIIP